MLSFIAVPLSSFYAFEEEQGLLKVFLPPMSEEQRKTNEREREKRIKGEGKYLEIGDGEKNGIMHWSVGRLMILRFCAHFSRSCLSNILPSASPPLFSILPSRSWSNCDIRNGLQSWTHFSFLFLFLASTSSISGGASLSLSYFILIISKALSGIEGRHSERTSRIYFLTPIPQHSSHPLPSTQRSKQKELLTREWDKKSKIIETYDDRDSPPFLPRSILYSHLRTAMKVKGMRAAVGLYALKKAGVFFRWFVEGVNWVG